MPSTVCPVCANRYARIIAPDCAVCKGAGVLVLGEAALSLYTPDVVATAVAVALEAVARTTDLTLTLSDDRTAPITAAVNQMTDAGVLAPAQHPPAPPHRHRPVTVLPRKRDTRGRYALEAEPTALAAEYVQEPILPIDLVLIEAKPYRYIETDRPNARGLPLLSNNGHPSHLVRVCDPVPVFDHDHPAGDNTRLTVRARARDRLHAEALHQAVPEAARRRLNRKRKAA